MVYEEGLTEDLQEALNFLVNSGYYDEEAIAEYSQEAISEIFDDYKLPEPSVAEIAKIIVNAQGVNSGSDFYTRIRKVFDQLNQEGIIAIDYAGFDISEGHDEVGIVFNFMKENNLPRVGYCFFHQQDIERCMGKKAGLFLAFHSMSGDDKKAVEVGQRIVTLLKQENFTVNWDGSFEQRIEIKDFLWDKAFDGKPSGTERALAIMEELRHLE